MRESHFINQVEPWYGDEEKAAIQAYLDSGGWIMEFKKTREFEAMIAAYAKARYVSVVTNGTVSLFIALTALGIARGDEVIVPDYTMIATPNAVLLTGATPVLVDVDPASMCIDVNAAEAAINARTKAIFHVSINGRAGDLERLAGLCEKKGVILLEDAAQSLGSFYKGRHLGTIGRVGSFSFSVPKIITTGQGGAVVTDDERLYNKMLRIKDFGRTKGGADIHDEMGWNFKFTDLQAVFGIEQMKKLPERVRRKRHIYRTYREMLSGVGEVQFLETDLESTTPWFIDIFVDEPEPLREFLKSNHIGARPVYPPIHQQSIFAHLKGDFNNTTSMCRRGLWLPSSSFLSDNDIARVCTAVTCFFKERGKVCIP